VRRRPAAIALALGLALLLALALLGAGCDRPGNRSAEELWAKYCARCHGADGRGVPRQLARYPNADLTRSRARGGEARAFFRRRIAEGYGPMPGFSQRLSPPELERLVDTSLRLAKKGN
jgi:mono/diheme cytochrome c family protein